MSITATAIRLPVGLDVPDGTKVEITLPDKSASIGEPTNALAWMTKHAGSLDGPEDFAAQHDHYVHEN